MLVELERVDEAPEEDEEHRHHNAVRAGTERAEEYEDLIHRFREREHAQELKFRRLQRRNLLILHALYRESDDRPVLHQLHVAGMSLGGRSDSCAPCCCSASWLLYVRQGAQRGRLLRSRSFSTPSMYSLPSLGGDGLVELAAIGGGPSSS